MTRSKRVALMCTLDTKREECMYLRDRLVERGLNVTVIDVGIMGGASDGDVTPDDVLARVGVDRQVLIERQDRGAAIAAMADGARLVMRDLYPNHVDAAISIGGAGNASIASGAFDALPFGVPKVLVSTMAAADTRPWVRGRDLTLMYPVVDIAGVNAVSRIVLTNAAAAVAGMLDRPTDVRTLESTGAKQVGASMLGVTTPCVDAARSRLGSLGYEVLIFHANGEGGATLERFVRSGLIDGVLDASTSELTNEYLGGITSAGPDRLTAAAEMGVPQVVAPGAMDILNFGPPETVPARFQHRLRHQHNAAATLVRTNPSEAAELGRRLAAKLNMAVGPVAVFVPTQGLSDLDRPGGPFESAEADEALFDALRTSIDAHVEARWVDSHINDPAFGQAMAERLNELIEGSGREQGRDR